MYDSYDPERARCASYGPHGRCQLRGVIGSGSASGGVWYCSWHDRIANKIEVSSRENFNRFISEEKRDGATRWDRLTLDGWWALVHGSRGPGGWEERTMGPQVVEDTEDHSEERPGYE